MTKHTDVLDAVAAVERALKNHKDTEIKLFERLRTVLHAHTKAVCRGLLAILQAFPDRKIVAIIEAEIANLGCMARPEDVVLWIEGVGAFVVEAKSHTIDGIRRFENDVPCVVYHGREVEDVELLDQPRDFAYKVQGQLEKACDGAGIEPLPLYYAGWMPNVSPEDIAQRNATVRKDRVWLSDMLDRDTFLSRIPCMKNVTRGRNVDRSGLTAFCSVFGITSGLRRSATPRSAPTGSMGQLIDRKRLALKRMTKEQEELAFHPNLVRGPKVIRGVAGSGKTVVLANAVAETLLRAMGAASQRELFLGPESHVPRILVLCYNRALAPYLLDLVRDCFDRRKPQNGWRLPTDALTVLNVDRLAHRLGGKANQRRPRRRVTGIEGPLIWSCVPICTHDSNGEQGK